MSALKAWAIGLFGGLLVCAPALAGDVEAGRRLAEQWCAACHITSPQQVSASDAAPSFMEIAKDPAKTRAGLEVWLSDPHPPMPKLSLSNREIDDLITYIKSLD
ncbi:MAG: c-type cytochrome [Pseudomonadota bacterium]